MSMPSHSFIHLFIHSGDLDSTPSRVTYYSDDYC